MLFERSWARVPSFLRVACTPRLLWERARLIASAGRTREEKNKKKIKHASQSHVERAIEASWSGRRLVRPGYLVAGQSLILSRSLLPPVDHTHDELFLGALKSLCLFLNLEEIADVAVRSSFIDVRAWIFLSWSSSTISLSIFSLSSFSLFTFVNLHPPAYACTIFYFITDVLFSIL